MDNDANVFAVMKSLNLKVSVQYAKFARCYKFNYYNKPPHSPNAANNPTNMFLYYLIQVWLSSMIEIQVSKETLYSPSIPRIRRNWQKSRPVVNATADVWLHSTWYVKTILI